MAPRRSRCWTPHPACRHSLGWAATGSTWAATPAILVPQQLRLSTIDGGLQLSGNGTLGASGFRFRGEATATDADRSALVNLLNIIGRRDGARSVIAIG